MRFEKRLLLMSFSAALPALLMTLALIWMVDLSAEARFALAFTVIAATAFLVRVMHHRLTFPMRTLANIVGALREEDYSLRARGSSGDDAYGELVAEVNRLAASLRERHLDALESSALVRSILGQLDAAIFLFDGEGRLRHMNRAAEQLLRMDAPAAVGRSATDLGLDACLAESLPSVLEIAFPGAAGRWSVRRSTFREKGRPHALLAITDVSRVLRDEELLAWQRLVRVLSHELNNSLASIHSAAETLQQIVSSGELSPDWRDDASRGLSIIASRAASLTRFTQSYAHLARLPHPELTPMSVDALVRRVGSLVFAMPVKVEEGPEALVMADADQLEQLLINLLQNAVDAVEETNGSIAIRWQLMDWSVEISVVDDGPGIAATKNLFVPFFTTKPGGTGIGLVLCRQIAEAHNGTLTLQNRPEGGCEARLRLPSYAGGAASRAARHRNRHESTPPASS